MNQIELVQQHLLDAADVPAVLGAGWEAFELVRDVAAVHASRSTDWYPAFTFARGAAVSGRNALAFAPSMPVDSVPQPGTAAPAKGEVYEVADAVAGLALALRTRLREAAGLAADAGDRAACEDAAGAAERIRELLVQGA